MCSQMLSLTGKKILNKVFGNQEYIKWAKKQRKNMPKTSRIFIFFKDKKPPLTVLIIWKIKKNIIFSLKKKEIGKKSRILYIGSKFYE